VGSENLSTILALRATEEQKRKSWEMAVRIEKILCTVLNEAHEQQVEEVMKTLAERPEGFYRTSY
jgi:alkylation response protein AidB-like acyl-CoA dehydrogenase